ncbi:MAG: phage antirepressor [Planctomycetes bacterium]|nr:phage antirepressor [Planctomycetota bacterium]
MSNIIPFNYHEKEIRIIQDEDGTPWWVLKDICEALEHKNPTVAMQMLDEDERAKKSLGRQGEANVINESGLYALILRSNKAEAKKFRKWVTSEVLPAIRKTGSYSMTAEKPTMISASDEFEAALKITKLLGLEGNQAALPANEAVKKLTGVDCLDLLGMTHLICETQEIHLTATELGKDLGLSAQKTNKLVESFGLIESFRCPKNKLRWRPTEEGKPFTVLKDTAKKNSDGTPIQQLYFLENIKGAIVAKEGNA